MDKYTIGTTAHTQELLEQILAVLKQILREVERPKAQ